MQGVKVKKERNQFECGYLEHKEGDEMKICR
jgi:hypothetical protein